MLTLAPKATTSALLGVSVACVFSVFPLASTPCAPLILSLIIDRFWSRVLSSGATLSSPNNSRRKFRRNKSSSSCAQVCIPSEWRAVTPWCKQVMVLTLSGWNPVFSLVLKQLARAKILGLSGKEGSGNAGDRCLCCGDPQEGCGAACPGQLLRCTTCIRPRLRWETTSYCVCSQSTCLDFWRRLEGQTFPSA